MRHNNKKTNLVIVSVSLAQEEVRKGTLEKDWAAVQNVGRGRGMRMCDGSGERVSSVRFSMGPSGVNVRGPLALRCS